MEEIECTTVVPQSVIPTGLLVRVWEKGTEEDIMNPKHYLSPVDLV